MTYETKLRIAGSHPALPGHFPGQPITPGVVLLDLALIEAERWLARPLSVAGLPQAKFTAPLPPEQDAQLKLELNADELKFWITSETGPIAQGAFRLNPERP